MPRGPAPLVVVLAAVLVCGGGVAAAQDTGKVYRIGTLEPARISRADLWDRLRQLGVIESKNLVVERRFADGDPRRFPELAAELVRLNVDLIVPITTPAAAAAVKATQSIPIVFLEVGDPVLSGIVQRLSRPGANATGLSSFNTDLAAKRLDLLKTVVPRLSRVAVLGCCLGSPADPLVKKFIEDTEAAAKSVNVTVQPFAPNNLEDAPGLFAAIASGRPDAVIVLPSPRGFDYVIRSGVVDLATKHRLPAIFDDRRYAEAGGLIAYGVDRPEMYRQAASLIHRVLLGAKPGDQPVQQPTRFELVVNVKTAKALSLELPHALTVRADRMIQ